ncbi:MAG: S9 family peptidase [Actinobacteria bacterium]|nr:S9 family peptidase [Actinomycetota bacterium]
MTETRVAPYGTWSSPITPRMLASAAVGLAETTIDDGVVYWIEARPAEAGRMVVVRGDAFSAPADVTPAGFNVRTKVHEYGGGEYCVHRGTVYFSNFDDQRLYRQEAGAQPEPITPDTDGRHRYADARVTADGALLLCVRERHEDADVVNELIVQPTGGGEARTIVGGHDFFAAPRISPDGSSLAWLAWDHPRMPWDGTELWVGDLRSDGSVTGAAMIAGGADESIFQPSWSPSNELHFVSDRTGWWNLYRQRDGAAEALRPMEAEFGWPAWGFGASMYAFLADGRIVCEYASEGLQHLAMLDPGSGELLDLDLPYTAIDYPYLCAEGSQVAFVGGGPAISTAVVTVDLGSRAVEILRESEDVAIDPGLLSTPRAIEFPTEGGLTAWAHFYPPANGEFAAPEGELPPLVVMSHGGPTSESTQAFDLRSQFFTSRGFGVVDVNYGGSTGYGRDYRRRLNGAWGVVDTMDCINAARFLAAEGLVDGSRLVIRGGSAGGYTTLCALVFHDDFATGASYYGLADLEPFASGGTHKFESRYLDSLVGPYPEAADLYRARSPIHFADMLSCPVILLQGLEDEVVPPLQAEIMVEALEAKGLPYAYLPFEGEQHGFRRAENIQAAHEAELSFYAQVFGFELGDPIPAVVIRNL